MQIMNKVFITAPKCKKPKWPSKGKSINKTWYIDIIGYSSTIKIKKFYWKMQQDDALQKFFLEQNKEQKSAYHLFPFM